MSTIFEKIGNGEIPSVKTYEDDVCFVILDINPVSKGHSLVISKKCYNNIGCCPDDVISHMILVAKKVDDKLREELNCDGTNILINNDPASGQEVPHIHIHVIPRYLTDGQKFGFKHEKYINNEIKEYGVKLKL